MSSGFPPSMSSLRLSSVTLTQQPETFSSPLALRNPRFLELSNTGSAQGLTGYNGNFNLYCWSKLYPEAVFSLCPSLHIWFSLEFLCWNLSAFKKFPCSYWESDCRTENPGNYFPQNDSLGKDAHVWRHFNHSLNPANLLPFLLQKMAFPTAVKINLYPKFPMLIFLAVHFRTQRPFCTLTLHHSYAGASIGAVHCYDH